MGTKKPVGAKQALDPGTRDFAAQIREVRKSRKITKAQLARASSLTWRTIARVEAGRPASAETEIAISRALGLNRPNGTGTNGIGRRLRDLRRATKQSMASVCVVLDISEGQLSKLETGKCQPRWGWADLLDDDYAHTLGFARSAELCAAVGVDAQAV